MTNEDGDRPSGQRTTTHGRAHHRVPRPPAALAVVLCSLLVLAGCASRGPGSADAAASSAPAAVTATRSAAPAGELPAELGAELEEALTETMAEYDVPGAAVGVWVPGAGSWTTAAGLADVEEGVAATTDMTWPLRSVTKSYTVTLLLQLVDEGRLSLDDTIDDYVSGVTDGGEITLRQLADMSSGNADYTNENFLKVYSEDPATIFTLEQLNGFMLGEPARFAPGTEKVYTNANTNLLGAVIEAVTGEPFDQALQERILDPLGQTGTHYLTDVTDWTEPHPAGYIVEDGVPVAQEQNPSIFQAAGSMFTTLDDARVWAETLGDGALLSQGLQRLREQGAPLDEGPPYDLYALGIGQTDGWWGHNGEGIGFTAAVFHDPASGASIAVFMNESNVPDVHPADATFRRFAEILGAAQ